MSFDPASLPNRFDFATAQPRLYAMWEQGRFFHAEPHPKRQPRLDTKPQSLRAHLVAATVRPAVVVCRLAEALPTATQGGPRQGFATFA